MKTERAIELLNRISDSQFDGIHGDERREALEIAVRALEQNLVKESGDLVQDLVKDCISRQAAIDAMAELQGRASTKAELKGISKAWKWIKKLPSVQPETHDKRTETHACDLINRQQAIDQLHQSYNLLDAEQRLEDLPSAQQQRKKGEWIDNDKINFPQCSECGMWIDVMQQSGEMNFCPNCGADMRGESE